MRVTGGHRGLPANHDRYRAVLEQEHRTFTPPWGGAPPAGCRIHPDEPAISSKPSATRTVVPRRPHGRNLVQSHSARLRASRALLDRNTLRPAQSPRLDCRQRLPAGNEFLSVGPGNKRLVAITRHRTSKIPTDTGHSESHAEPFTEQSRLPSKTTSRQ